MSLGFGVLGLRASHNLGLRGLHNLKCRGLRVYSMPPGSRVPGLGFILSTQGSAFRVPGLGFVPSMQDSGFRAQGLL